MSWCNVRPSRNGTRIILRRACSVALRMASGTSRALPAPKPTRPFLSPTTTRAANPNRRPPFTTLATRLMLTSFSVNSLSSRSRDCRSLSPRPRRSPCVRVIERAMLNLSEIETALTGGVGQGFDPAMKQISAPIEHDPLDTRRLGPRGNERADGVRRRYVGAILEARPEAIVEARSRRDRTSGGVIDDLRIDVLRRAEHRQTRSIVCRTAQFVADPLATTQEESFGFLRHKALLLFAFLPANVLGCVSDTFAFVGFGWPISTDVGRDLTDALAIGSAYGDNRRPIASDPDVAGDRKRDVVTIAKLEIESVALNLCAIANPRDLQIDRKPRYTPVTMLLTSAR